MANTSDSAAAWGYTYPKKDGRKIKSRSTKKNQRYNKKHLHKWVLNDNEICQKFALVIFNNPLILPNLPASAYCRSSFTRIGIAIYFSVHSTYITFSLNNIEKFNKFSQVILIFLTAIFDWHFIILLKLFLGAKEKCFPDFFFGVYPTGSNVCVCFFFVIVFLYLSFILCTLCTQA